MFNKFILKIWVLSIGYVITKGAEIQMPRNLYVTLVTLQFWVQEHTCPIIGKNIYILWQINH